MQKNKFIHEDINAVCNRAAKKLVAMGLAVAVGGSCTVGHGNRLIACAQTSEELAKIEAVLKRAYNLDRMIGLSENQANSNRNRDRQRLLTNPSEIDTFEALIDGEIEAAIDNIRRREFNRRNERPMEIELESDTTPVQQNDLGGPQMIRARENQHIEAGPNTHVCSFSNNELTHEGEGEAKITEPGSVDIDVGDATVSECNEDLSRNVKVKRANSLTVAPGTSTRIQNGTEFTIGRTAQETLENLQHAMGLIPDNRQPMAPSNIFVRFFSGLVSVFTYILFGRWLGGSK